MILFQLLHVLALLPVMTQTELGSCNFDQSSCGYTSDPSYARWTMNEDGHFITADRLLMQAIEKAVLLSPQLHTFDWSCLRFVYQITGSGSLQLNHRSEEDSHDIMLWSTDKSSDSWLTTSIDLRNTSTFYQVVLEGTPGPQLDSTVAIFKIDVVPGYCVECDFEDPDLCMYTSPAVPWYVGKKLASQSSKPNLLQSHTWINKTDHYMYVDSAYTQEIAKLVSPMTTTPLLGCLSFYYNCDRETGSSLSVLTRDQLNQYQELWVTGINSKLQWTLVQVDVKAAHPVELVFEVTFNSNSGARVAIDDVSFSPEFCYPQTEAAFDPSIADCNFEKGYCQYTDRHKGGAVWNRISVKPNLYNMGDHTTGLGSFITVTTQIGQPSPSMAELRGPLLPGQLTYCLRFYYTLHGFSSIARALAVYAYDHSGAHENIWTATASSRDVWTEALVTFQRADSTQLVFVNMCIRPWHCGSVALDDITVTLGDCRLITGPLLSMPGTCTFEEGVCEFTQNDNDDSADWLWIRGPTPTSYTGPMGDHTTGTGHYVYIEASSMLPGQSARLVSSTQRGSKTPQCLQFHYHMYGSGTGQLNVLLQLYGGDKHSLLWSRHGEQSMSWMKASVDYQSDLQHQIVFEAVRGPSIRSDVAIDDIAFKKGPCPESDTGLHSRHSESFNVIEY